jgi:hypothetical protein
MMGDWSNGVVEYWNSVVKAFPQKYSGGKSRGAFSNFVV